MKQRDIGLDVIRILACFMVVFMHSPIPSGNANGLFLTALSYLTAPCIGLFFMVSGALLLPVKMDYFTFIRKRFGKIIVPTVIWSIICIILKLYTSESEINLLQNLASIPFSAQGSGVLWFMYTLAWLYLLAPILSAWVECATKKELQFILLLWGITLCYPLFDFYLITNTSETGILYYFTGYAGYFLLGYYLKRYPQNISISIIGMVAIVGPILLFALKRAQIDFDFYQLFWYQSIFIVASAIVIWKICYKLVDILDISCKMGREVLKTLSNLSFGVYLCHILIMRNWLWNTKFIQQIPNYMVQTIIIATCTFILSITLCYILSRLPFADWLIGYKHSYKR